MSDDLNPLDRDAMMRTVIGEAGNQGPEGIAAGGVGGGLTSTDVSNLYSRIHTFLHAVNPTTFP
jgi:hypothetical protein